MYKNLFFHECLTLFRGKLFVIEALSFVILSFVAFRLMLPFEAGYAHIVSAALLVLILVWVAVQSYTQFWRYDYEIGIIEVLLQQNYYFVPIFLLKAFAFWLVRLLPLILLSIIVHSLFYALPLHASLWYMVILAILGLFLTLITCLGSCFFIVSRQNVFLLFLLLLPLFLPGLIFTTHFMLHLQDYNLLHWPDLLIMLGILCIMCVICPFLGARIIKIALQNQ